MIENKVYNTVTEKVTHRVYMRDWYYNAGIAGFLYILLDGKRPTEITGLTIGDNYIEFESKTLQGFEEKFRRKSFSYFFKLELFFHRIDSNIKEIEEALKTTKNKRGKKTAYFYDKMEKFPFKGFLNLFSNRLKNIINLDDFLSELKNIKAQLEAFHNTGDTLYKTLSEIPEGSDFISLFIKNSFKGIAAENKIPDYISSISKLQYQKPLKINDTCLSCQTRKVSVEFNNAVSNIIGFNKDNSNWIWGYKTGNLRICSVCALINACSIFSFVFLLKKAEKGWLNYFYTINRNSSVSDMFNAVSNFKSETRNANEKIFYHIIQHTVREINEQQARNISENINFIEIIDNPILSGQSSKGYTIFNYNIEISTANFLKKHFGEKKIPIGYYQVNKDSRDLTEEILRLTISHKLDYNHLDYYWRINLSGKKNQSIYIPVVSKYIFDYINHRKGRNMKSHEQSIKRGFQSGAQLRENLIKQKKANQINGLVYGFLNDLKIADREKFMDKYLRSVMSQRMPSSFGKEEMQDTDSFLQFGYSFINGLMNPSREERNTTNNEGESS